MRRAWVGVVVLATVGGPVAAQDTIPVDRGVRVGITYTPGVRPGMLMLGGPPVELMDSVRTILARDLDYSDRFEMITLPGGDSLVLGVAGGESDPGGDGEPFVNYALYAALGAAYTVHVQPPAPASTSDPGPDAPADTVLRVTLYDVRGRGVRHTLELPAGRADDPEFRLAVHRAGDELVRAAAGSRGVAATRLLFLQHGRVYRIDSDGWGLTPVTPAGRRAFSPVWAPDGRRFAWVEFVESGGRIVVEDPAETAGGPVQPTTTRMNFTPVFSPDGGRLVFARATGEGTDLWSYNLADDCCLQRLTVGRFSDNLSPSFSPDGRRVAFVSTRAGLPQIYVMAADGTGQELFAPFDYGVTGSSNAPEWSPDGLSLAFHRDVAGSPQVFVMDVATRTVRQLTSLGRNEDPTWAPDGRHLAFVSSRTGTRQIWVIDLDTGRIRQVTRVGDARLPAWSPRID